MKKLSYDSFTPLPYFKKGSDYFRRIIYYWGNVLYLSSIPIRFSLSFFH